MQESIVKEPATKNIPIAASLHAKLLAQAEIEGRTIRRIAERYLTEGLEGSIAKVATS